MAGHRGNEIGVGARDVGAYVLLEAAFQEDRYYDMTDAQLGELLEKHVWPELGLMSRASGLVSQAIDRLKRSGGGALPRPREGEDDADAGGSPG